MARLGTTRRLGQPTRRTPILASGLGRDLDRRLDLLDHLLRDVLFLLPVVVIPVDVVESKPAQSAYRHSRQLTRYQTVCRHPLVHANISDECLCGPQPS